MACWVRCGTVFRTSGGVRDPKGTQHPYLTPEEQKEKEKRYRRKKKIRLRRAQRRQALREEERKQKQVEYELSLRRNPYLWEHATN